MERIITPEEHAAHIESMRVADKVGRIRRTGRGDLAKALAEDKAATERYNAEVRKNPPPYWFPPNCCPRCGHVVGPVGIRVEQSFRCQSCSI